MVKKSLSIGGRAAPPRSGHGAASVIPHLTENAFEPQASSLEQGAAGSDSPQASGESDKSGGEPDTHDSEQS
ncbi:hypothetical protein [Caenimonas aquaedulcis]|uniref:Uncharacterized protein n=1 Tax=Caenimonas aquaedulcis TaxID=2793270 RepID=A0A931H3K5_9BURK|nr:hypothetical protein [Caenimonas aquaedulcis]MBG9387955.1 hypothetical protein [Caenimonas aquaedulcis]